MQSFYCKASQSIHLDWERSCRSTRSSGGTRTYFPFCPASPRRPYTQLASSRHIRHGHSAKSLQSPFCIDTSCSHSPPLIPFGTWFRGTLGPPRPRSRRPTEWFGTSFWIRLSFRTGWNLPVASFYIVQYETSAQWNWWQNQLLKLSLKFSFGLECIDL